MINISLNGCEWKQLRRKTVAQDVFDRRWSIDWVKTLIKISVWDLYLSWSLQWGRHCVVHHNPNESRDATAVTFSIKCFNPLKLYPLSGNIFKKWFASYFELAYAQQCLYSRLILLYVCAAVLPVAVATRKTKTYSISLLYIVALIQFIILFCMS